MKSLIPRELGELVICYLVKVRLIGASDTVLAVILVVIAVMRRDGPIASWCMISTVLSLRLVLRQDHLPRVGYGIISLVFVGRDCSRSLCVGQHLGPLLVGQRSARPWASSSHSWWLLPCLERRQ